MACNPPKKATSKYWLGTYCYIFGRPLTQTIQDNLMTWNSAAHWKNWLEFPDTMQFFEPRPENSWESRICFTILNARVYWTQLHVRSQGLKMPTYSKFIGSIFLQTLSRNCLSSFVQEFTPRIHVSNSDYRSITNEGALCDKDGMVCVQLLSGTGISDDWLSRDVGRCKARRA
jgi:hypothetical protein